MNKLIPIILFLFLVLAISGCIGQEPQDVYKQLSAKKADNFRADYELSMESSQTGAGGLLTGITIDVSITKLGEKLKAILEMNAFGSTTLQASYKINDKIVMCTEAGTGGMNCNLVETTTSGMFDTNIFFKIYRLDLGNKLAPYNIKFSNDRTIASRPSRCFNMSAEGEAAEGLIKNSFFGSMTAMAGSLPGVKAEVDICLDQETGIITDEKLSIKRFSEIKEEYVDSFSYTFKLKKFSQNVDDSDFKIPLAFEVRNLTCTKDKAKFTMFAYNEINSAKGEVNLSAENGEKVELGGFFNVPEIEQFSEKTFEVNLETGLSVGYQALEVCIGKDCSEATSCWVEAMPVGDTFAYWHFNSNGTDSSSNGADLVIDEEKIDWVDGLYGQAVYMSVNEGWSDCPSVGAAAISAPGSLLSYPGIGDWTIEALVKVDSLSENYSVINQYSLHLAGHEPYAMHINHGEVNFEIYDSENNVEVISTGNPVLEEGKWAHIAVIYRYGKKMQIYINGKLRTERDTWLIPENRPTTDVFLGGTNCGTSKGIAIDEMRVSNKAIAASDFEFLDKVAE